jgi:hypothetical protein
MTKLVGEHVLMRIFIGESDKFNNRPLHEALVELFKREGFAGATVLRGVAGYGAHSVYHTDRILRLSRDLPVIVEVVDTQENIDRVMPRKLAMYEAEKDRRAQEQWAAEQWRRAQTPPPLPDLPNSWLSLLATTISLVGFSVLVAMRLPVSLASRRPA